MKNKLFLGLAVLLIAGAFTGCKDEILDVRNVPDKANAPGNVTATLTTDETAVIVAWDAADNANGYRLYYRVKDTKTATLSNVDAQNTQTYAVANGNATANPSPDKWSGLILIGSLTGKKSYEFGVQTNGALEGGANASDIVWSNTITTP
jgi:hypothetical protein